MNRGVLVGVVAALGAFSIWGLFPVYWHLLGHVEPFTVLSHRVLWSAPFVGLVILVGRRWHALVAAVREPRHLVVLVATAVLISVNWGVYIWAVSVGKVVEASMGYFLTPLFNVLLGFAMFRERLAPIQWLAVGIAGAGVLYLFVARDVAPWVALTLAVSFAGYGALRKQAVSDSITGLFLETLLVAPAAWIYLGILSTPGGGFGDFSPATDLLLVGAGVITATPLLLFVAAAKRLHYATVGLLFYLTPSMQFVLGVTVFGETLERVEIVAFACVWTALVLFAAHGYIVSRRRDAA